MPQWQTGFSETLDHADTFQHDCQLVTKNAIKTIFWHINLGWPVDYGPDGFPVDPEGD